MKPAIILILIIIFYELAIARIYAIKMSNSQYDLEMSNLNSFSGKPSGSGYKLGETGGQTGAGLYSSGSGQNYKVRSGFWYIKSVVPFSFSISQTTIDFGTLTAANPVTRTNTITVGNNSAYGYNIFAYENKELNNPGNGSIIPNTTCDNGTCTDTNSALWTSSLTYGFGFRCDNVVGSDCDSGFTTSNYFRQFPNNSLSKPAQSLMSGTISRSNQAKITYKVNISGSQPAGLYTNNIYFLAVPKY